MRGEGFQAKGVHLSLLFQNHEYWHQGLSLSQPIFSSQDIYRVAYRLLRHSPYRLPVRNLAVSCYDLSSRTNLQLGIFDDNVKKDNLTKAIDDINHRWGNFVITPATMANMENHVHDRISFGNVRGLI
jgi:DNA polymerase-4